MICFEDIGRVLPTAHSGKIVGIASYRGEYLVVACEYGLFKLWDDGIDIRITETAPTPGEISDAD